MRPSRSQGSRPRAGARRSPLPPEQHGHGDDLHGQQAIEYEHRSQLPPDQDDAADDDRPQDHVERDDVQERTPLHEIHPSRRAMQHRCVVFFAPTRLRAFLVCHFTVSNPTPSAVAAISSVSPCEIAETTRSSERVGFRSACPMAVSRWRAHGCRSSRRIRSRAASTSYLIAGDAGRGQPRRSRQ